jgi:hypothetical protein
MVLLLLEALLSAARRNAILLLRGRTAANQMGHRLLTRKASSEYFAASDP